MQKREKIDLQVLGLDLFRRELCSVAMAVHALPVDPI